MKKYSKKQIQNTIKYWKKQLNESYDSYNDMCQYCGIEKTENNNDDWITSKNGMSFCSMECAKKAGYSENDFDEDQLNEDIVKFKNLTRTPSQAREQAKANPITQWDPFGPLTKRWKIAKEKTKKLILTEFKGSPKELRTEDENEIEKIRFINTLYNNKTQQIQNFPADGYFYLGISMYMEQKKSAFSRLFTGRIGLWFHKLEIAAMKELVKNFIGNDFAKQVTEKTVFNALGEDEEQGKNVTYICFKIPSLNAKKK